MPKYYKILKNSWNELLKDYVAGRFKPLAEADIQCYLYHLCLKRIKNPSRIHAEWHKKKKRIDIMLGNEALPIEIKWSYSGPNGKIRNRWLADVKKLSNQFSKRKPVVVVFITRQDKNFSLVRQKELSLYQLKKIQKCAKKTGVRVLLPNI